MKNILMTLIYMMLIILLSASVVLAQNQVSTSTAKNASSKATVKKEMQIIKDGSSPCEAFALPFSESFNEPTIPECWTEQKTGLITTNHWLIFNTAYAGGVPYEAAAIWDPGEGSTQADNDRLVSPALITTGLTNLKVSFRQMLNDYAAGVNDVWIKVQSSADGNNWTDEWVYGGGLGVSIPAEVKELNVTNNLGGITYIAWTLSGFTYDINYWFLDDINISVPLAHDVKTVSIDMPSIVAPGIMNPLATVKNDWLNPETFDVNMTIGDYSSTKSVSLSTGASVQVTFDPWNAAVGNYTMSVCTQLVGDLDPANDCKTKNQSVQALRKVYGYVAYDPMGLLPLGPAWFYVQTPGTITSIAATSSDQFISAGAWANGTWYGSEYYVADYTPNGGGWWTIDPTTGAMTKLGDPDIGFAGITYDKVSGIMYGTNWNGVYDELYTIDLATGAATLLGSYSTQLGINLAADGSGFLYSIGIFDDQLYRIIPTSPPTAVAIGPTGYDFSYAQDMEYDYDNNIMYVTGYTVEGGLYIADLTTGDCTPIGTFQNGAEITGFAIPYTTCANPTYGGEIGFAQANCGEFNPVPLVNIAYPSGYIGNLEYKWQYSTDNVSFFDFAGSNSETFDPELISQTTWFKRVVRADCMQDWTDAAESNVIEASVYPIPIVNAGMDATIYIGYPPYSAQLNALGTGSGNYSWSPSIGLSDPNIANPIASPASTKTYTVTFTDENGCSDFDDVTIVVMDVRCGNKLEKVLVCHNPPGNNTKPQTICIGFEAVQAHLAHGDYLGSCIKIKTSESGNDDISNDLSITVSPNPFIDKCKIGVYLNESSNTDIQIIDLLGRPICKLCNGMLEKGQHSFTWNLEQPSNSGSIYFLMVKTSYSVKIVKILSGNN
jgi:hypothetical protein